MVWARLDDQFPQHGKVWTLSDAAFRLHVAGICHSSWLLTDGIIRENRVAGLVPNFRRRLVVELIGAEVWHAHGHDCEPCAQPPKGSLVIHGFLDCNPSAEKVKKERDEAAERKRVWKAKKDAERAANAARNPVGGRVPERPPDPDPTRPDPKGLGSGGTSTVTDDGSPAPSGGEPPDTHLSPEQIEQNVQAARAARQRLRAVGE